MRPDLTVVICSLNGAAGVERCLRALASQTIVDRLQLVVVDDGSTDGTSLAAARPGVTVIRHEVNRGLAAARNTGIAEANAPVVAFLDDDCVPAPDWAEQLLQGYDDGVLGVGGSIDVSGPDRWLIRYLRRHNPLLPLELDLAYDTAMLYRLRRYLYRQWGDRRSDRPRDVFSLVGANMSFRLDAIRSIGGFDERFTFGAEELEACLRLRDANPGGRLRLMPGAVVAHEYVPVLSDTLRRSRAYGRGSARLHRVHPAVPLTVFPAPVVVPLLALAALALRRPRWAALAVALPAALFPTGPLDAVVNGRVVSLADPWVQLLQEGYGDWGVLAGLREFRRVHAHPAAIMTPTTEPTAERVAS